MTLQGTLNVRLPVHEAFRLFTATGERDWVDGWDPVFPGSVADDADVGTVFRTDHGGQAATWVVVDREGDSWIRYARVADGRDAGTVDVRLAPTGDHTAVTVTYRLTALTSDGERWLSDFVANYPEMLREWETAIANHLGEGGSHPR